MRSFITVQEKERTGNKLLRVMKILEAYIVLSYGETRGPTQVDFTRFKNNIQKESNK